MFKDVFSLCEAKEQPARVWSRSNFVRSNSTEYRTGGILAVLNEIHMKIAKTWTNMFFELENTRGMDRQMAGWLVGDLDLLCSSLQSIGVDHSSSTT